MWNMDVDKLLQHDNALALWRAAIDVAIYDSIWKVSPEGKVSRKYSILRDIKSNEFKNICAVTDTSYNFVLTVAEATPEEQALVMPGIIAYLRRREHGQYYAGILEDSFNFKSEGRAYRAVENPRVYKRWCDNPYSNKRQRDAIGFLGEVAQSERDAPGHGKSGYFARLLQKFGRSLCPLPPGEPSASGLDDDDRVPAPTDHGVGRDTDDDTSD